MRRTRSLTLMLLLVFAGTAPALAQGAPPPGTGLGQKIGTAIRAAIDTALPGVTDLVSLLFKKGDKQTKDELTTNIAAAEKTLKVNAQQKLKPVSAVASELQVVGRFLEPATTAHEAVLAMQASAAPDKADWDVAKAQLDIIRNIADDDVDKVRDLWLRNELKQIKAVNGNLAIRIGDEMSKTPPDAARLSGLLGRLEGVLSSITLAVGYEMADLQADLKDLSDWVNGSAGIATSGTGSPITTQQQRFRDRIARLAGSPAH